MKNLIGFLIISICMTILTSQRLPAQENAKQKRKTRIACIGDSITFGARLKNRASDSYPAQLQKILGDKYEVMNLGVGSCTLIRKGRPTVWKQLKKIENARPDIVIISLGTNDTCGGKRKCWDHKDEFPGDYRDLIDRLRALPSKPKIWICAPTPIVLETPGLGQARITDLRERQPRLQELIKNIKAVAKEKQVGLVDLNTPLANKPEFFTVKDGVHPNKKGYRKMAEIISQKFPQKKNEAVKNKLKIINWNVLYGFNHHQSIEAGASWLENQNPDIVGLQELNRNTEASLKELAKTWGHEHSAILKERGFPVGLTSNKPIQVIERRFEDFHHGFMHCKTHGIHFFIIHFWPAKKREADIILEKIKPLLASNEKIIVMGDFNSHSRKNKKFLDQKTAFTPRYSDIDKFENNGFVDLAYKHDPKAEYSFPSPLIIPQWAKTLEEVEQKRQRIDFILADESLQNHSISGTVMLSESLDKISDHYPVVVELNLNYIDK